MIYQPQTNAQSVIKTAGMAIVDMAYYDTVYHGEEASESEFPALEARAEDVIGAMTRWQVTACSFACLPPFQKALARKAICAQIDFFALNGLDSVDTQNGRGFHVGNVGITGKSGGDLIRKGAMQDSVSPLAIQYLEQSGLMNPAVPVLGGML